MSTTIIRVIFIRRNSFYFNIWLGSLIEGKTLANSLCICPLTLFQTILISPSLFLRWLRLSLRLFKSWRLIFISHLNIIIKASASLMTIFPVYLWGYVRSEHETTILIFAFDKVRTKESISLCCESILKRKVSTHVLSEISFLFNLLFIPHELLILLRSSYSGNVNLSHRFSIASMFVSIGTKVSSFIQLSVITIYNTANVFDLFHLLGIKMLFDIALVF